MVQAKATERGPGRRQRRSRQEVSEALIDATAALLAERPSGRVTVRDIAARADVNATFVHRYFGSKHELMRAAMARAQQHLVERVEQMRDVADGAAVFRTSLGEREFIAALARATLDGVFTDVPAGTPAIRRLLERFEAESEQRGARGRHELRIVVTGLAAATMGYALFGDYIRRGARLDEIPDDEVETQLVELLQDVARLAFRD